MQQNEQRAVIFDFDGVLADTFPLMIRILRKLAAEDGHPFPDAGELEELREMDSRAVIERLNIPTRRLPALIRKVRAEIAGHADELPPFPGMEEALTRLADNGFQLGIVTSNGDETIRRFLRAQGWQPRFNGWESGSTLFGKARLIKRWLASHGIPPSQAAYVGDETRDIEAARKSGTKAIAATWGYATTAAMKRQRPDVLALEPADIPGALLERN